MCEPPAPCESDFRSMMEAIHRLDADIRLLASLYAPSQDPMAVVIEALALGPRRNCSVCEAQHCLASAKACAR